MKKFLIAATVIFIIITSYIDEFISLKIQTSDYYFTKVIDKEIYMAKNNKWEKFYIKGINMSSTKPGVYPNDNNVTYEEYLRWISLIYDMGVNCIRVPNLMGQDFYKALEDFNSTKKDPIYLMQGIYFDESYLQDGYDPQNINLKSIFKDNIKLIVDAVHGNSYNLDDTDILKNYNTDVSEYVIGYTVGIEFEENDLIYTEIMNEKKSYFGKYIYTDNDASSFESYLAQMGDYLADYENKNYKEQRLISFIGSSHHIVNSIETQNSDDTTSNLVKDKYLAKKYVDIENIKYNKKLKTGIVASYNIFPSYLEMKQYYGNLKYYIDIINDYHTVPVIISELGIPSSRVVNSFSKGEEQEYIDEEKQGELLVQAYREIKASNCSGGFIFEFQDTWSRVLRSNKVRSDTDGKLVDRSAYWNDAQTYSQSFGVMAFEPGEAKDISYPDESIDEWNKDNIVSEDENISLSMKSDEKYLYFMIKSLDTFNFEKSEIYIDLDITPNSGVEKSSQFDLIFEKPIDFIININGKENSRVYVHEYYNEFNFNKNKKLNKARPDLMNYKYNMDEFSKIFIEVTPKMYIESLKGFTEEVNYETGKLVHGNANPESYDFNSVSDFYIGDNYIEVRIPWALLNFMDPSTKQIKGDFYKEFKITLLQINEINVGFTIKDNGSTIKRMKSELYDLDGWIMPNYHERLKQSYYILKEELNKG